jgi:hypothetical protein
MRRIVSIVGVVALIVTASPRLAVASTTDSMATNSAITILPVVTTLPDGSMQSTYTLPNGGVETIMTPPPGFDALDASNRQLAELDFPLRPTDATDLQDWTEAMASFKSDSAPGAMQVDASSAMPLSGTIYDGWGGWAAGTPGIHAHTYVAIKTVFWIPSNSGCGSTNGVGFWIGLGGTYTGYDLLQQGVECGAPKLGGGNVYRPFHQFAITQPYGQHFCNNWTTWTFSTNDKIYQNMSFQTSTNTAYFYLQDENTGVAHSCALPPPSGWAWGLNTAEWIGEAPGGTSYNFGSVHFTDAMTELSSNSTWVTLDSQPLTDYIEGSQGTNKCISPGGIGSDGASFYDYWYSGSCI